MSIDKGKHSRVTKTHIVTLVVIYNSFVAVNDALSLQRAVSGICNLNTTPLATLLVKLAL